MKWNYVIQGYEKKSYPLQKPDFNIWLWIWTISEQGNISTESQKRDLTEEDHNSPAQLNMSHLNVL